MSNEVYAFALKSALDEIHNACPDVTSNFVFNDGKLLAKNENTTEENATQTITAFDEITDKADPIGDIEDITIQTAKGKINIAATNDFYLTTVSSKEADEKYVNTLTRILIPIVIKLAEKVQPASLPNNETITLDQPEPEPEEDTEEAEETYDASQAFADETIDEAKTEETEEDNENEIPAYSYKEEIAPEPAEEEIEQAEPEIDDEPLLPEPPATQLIVENLKGFRVPSDTVRIDQEVIDQWSQLFGDVKINEVEVEALNGKTTRCKFKNIKKSKDSGKGIIKMPEKIQLTLETQQGELVTVKPVVE
jgi:hypothetical protein